MLTKRALVIGPEHVSKNYKLNTHAHAKHLFARACALCQVCRDNPVAFLGTFSMEPANIN